MSFYGDSSFLFSYYASDANSSRADSWRQVHTEPLPFTVLHRLELRNAFELAVFQNRITAKEAGELWSQVETDLTAGLLFLPPLSLPDLFLNAEALARDHTAQTGARSLDILHVATARLLAIDELVTFDLRQAALASRIGLRVAVL
jgi:predicted nucleic acid-binding protein